MSDAPNEPPSGADAGGGAEPGESEVKPWTLLRRRIQGERPPLPEGREVDPTRLLVLASGFVNALREAGIEVPIESTITYVRALSAVGDLNRSARYWCGRATLITRSEDFPTYHRVFGAYWLGSDPDAEVEVVRMVQNVAVDVADEGAESEDEATDGEGNGEPDVVMRWSAVEVLRDKDFAEYSDEETRELSHLMSSLRIAGALKSSRRLRASKARRGSPDLRRTVRRALATDGEPIERRFRVRSEQPRRVVLLLDISGSMETYSRALLRFVHATVLARGRVEAFTLGTRLTRLTRELATLDPDRALENAAASVEDWSGGTRLGAALRTFNDEWAVRGMARGSVVVIMSDGWDRGDPAVMDEQMMRLRRVAHRIIWSNPLKATDGYAPLARGMAAALPHIDEFVEGHSLGALERLAEAVTRSAERTPAAARPQARAVALGE